MVNPTPNRVLPPEASLGSCVMCDGQWLMHDYDIWWPRALMAVAHSGKWPDADVFVQPHTAFHHSSENAFPLKLE